MARYYSLYESPVGTLCMVSDGEALTQLSFLGQKYAKDHADCEEKWTLPVFDDTRRWLDLYFQGQDPGFWPKMKVEGSEFRQLVCQLMLMIPFGGTTNYGEIAREVARRTGRKTMSSQAVGGAVGHNPIGIIIPCHRVLGSNGSLTGYAGGLERKEYLLQLEGVLL